VRENRTHGSEGGEVTLPDPYHPSNALINGYPPSRGCRFESDSIPDSLYFAGCRCFCS